METWVVALFSLTITQLAAGLAAYLRVQDRLTKIETQIILQLQPVWDGFTERRRVLVEREQDRREETKRRWRSQSDHNRRKNDDSGEV